MLLEAEVNNVGKLSLYYCFLLGNNKSDRSAVTVGYTPTPTLLLPSSLLSSTAWPLKGKKPCCKLRESHAGSACLGLLQAEHTKPSPASSPLWSAAPELQFLGEAAGLEPLHFSEPVPAANGPSVALY